MNRVPTVAAVLCMLAAAVAVAQDDEPADGRIAGVGTTIIGEQESAVGLYLMPWQDETASDIDRPPGLYLQPLEAIDAGLFRRRAEYEEARLAYRRERLQRSR